jgi:AraC family transcriptional regulator
LITAQGAARQLRPATPSGNSAQEKTLKQDTRQDYQERMLRVLIHIQKNLDRSPSLEEIASVANFSPFHFHRIFRGMTGESFKAHLRRLRMEKAASRLSQTGDPVIRIALDSGFESHAAFSRAFKSQMGISPSQWRQSSQKQELPVPHSDPRELIFQNKGDKTMEVKIVKKDEMRVAFVRHTGPYDQCGRAWGKLCSHLGAQGRLGGQTSFIGLSYDDPEITPEDKIRYDACVEVDEGFQPEAEIGVQILPAGTFATTTHFGPYENLKHTYAALLGQWLPGSGRRFKLEPTREIYLNDPESTPPEDLVTDLYLPLED